MNYNRLTSSEEVGEEPSYTKQKKPTKLKHRSNRAAHDEIICHVIEGEYMPLILVSPTGASHL